MKRSIVIIARNEKQWTEITATNFKHQFVDAEIVGVDDGGKNVWPDFVRVIKTGGEIGVGRCRRLGVERAKGDIVCITDGHVLFDRGDKEKAWRLADEGNVVTFTTKSLKTGLDRGSGRIHNLEDHSAKNTDVEEGMHTGLIGGVYFMLKSVAMDIIGPTPSHGFNEQIMTVGALAFGHPIYAYPGMAFHHLYKKEFNYTVTVAGQLRNRNLLKWWFLDGKPPLGVTPIEKQYHKHVQENRTRDTKEIVQLIKDMNKGRLPKNNKE